MTRRYNFLKLTAFVATLSALALQPPHAVAQQDCCVYTSTDCTGPPIFCTTADANYQIILNWIMEGALDN